MRIKTCYAFKRVKQCCTQKRVGWGRVICHVVCSKMVERIASCIGL